MTEDMRDRYKRMQVAPHWKHVLDILIQKDMSINAFNDFVGLNNGLMISYLRGHYEPSQNTLRYICEGLEKLTGVSRKEHSLILLWGLDD